MATKQYMNVKRASELWGLTERRVRILCSEGRVDGVIRNGWAWNIPEGAPKPQDGRNLRPVKNTALRPGSANYGELDALHGKFVEQKDDEGYVLRTFRSFLPDFVTGAFAFDGITVDNGEVEKLFQGEKSDSLTLEQELTALNCRTILLRTLKETGFGPIEKQAHDVPYLSQRKIRLMYRDLLAGIDDMNDSPYRKASLPAGGTEDDRVFSIEQQMATLLYQYEQEWQMLHPLVRASFLFGEMLRLRPFGNHDGMMAFLAMGRELIAYGYPPVLLMPSQCEECRADLALTKRRGNYQPLIAFYEANLTKSLKRLMRVKE